MGKLFDESGEPLYSCWAKKGQRRYRYLVSKKLVRGTATPDERGWRLPAERTELAVMAGTRQMLSDRGALGSTLRAFGFAAAELKQAIEAIDSKVKSHQRVETAEDTGTLIERVELRRDGMQITLNLRALLPSDRFPAGGANLHYDASCSATDEASWRRNASGAPRRSGASFRGQTPRYFEPWLADTSGSVNWRRELRCRPSRSRPAKVSATAMCAIWCRSPCSLQQSWNPFVQGGKASASPPSVSRLRPVFRSNGTRSSGSLRIRGSGLSASYPPRTFDLANVEASGRNRKKSARGTESFLNREEWRRINDLQE